MTARPSAVRARLRAAVAPAITAAFIAVFAFCLLVISQDGHPMSVVDEHIHFDTAIQATHGEIPWRGALLTQELVDEWACGVGHEGGGMPYPCGDPRLGPDSVPSGMYTTGYIHYPTFFFAAAGFQPIWAAVTGNDSLIDGFRAFSAVTLILGLVVTAVMAWLLRLRGAALVAATSLPVAASMLVFVGTIVNPTSLSLLAGSLIAGSSLLWMRRRTGFIWVALCVSVGSLTAVTVSLPAGATLVAMLIVLVGQRFGLFASAWRPRWWQFGVLAAIVLVPVVVWGRVIAARATVSNDVLYGFIEPSGRKDIAVGIVRELTALHTPWRETGGIHASPEGIIPRLLQAFSAGAPSWITVIVFGVLVIAAVLQTTRAAQARRAASAGLPPITGAGDRGLPDAAIYAVGALVTIVLYPPALRLSNWITFGFDFPIVDRYSSALAPVLVLALLVWLPQRRWVLGSAAAIGVVTALGTVAAGL